MPDLFDLLTPAPHVEARAAAADPATSHEAADRVTRSGRATANAAAVLALMRAHPGLTSRELSELPGGLDRHETARRCSDLERAGAARKGAARVCRVGGTRAVTWWAED